MIIFIWVVIILIGSTLVTTILLRVKSHFSIIFTLATSTIRSIAIIRSLSKHSKRVFWASGKILPKVSRLSGFLAILVGLIWGFFPRWSCRLDTKGSLTIMKLLLHSIVIELIELYWKLHSNLESTSRILIWRLRVTVAYLVSFVLELKKSDFSLNLPQFGWTFSFIEEHAKVI